MSDEGDRGRPKVFCVGFSKTGTTTLHQILGDQLSYRSAHKPGWTDWSITKNRDQLDRFDAFTDGECAAIRNLDDLYPDALFVLNTRPLKHWVLSRHKAVERSRTGVRWALTKYVPLGFVARIINRWVLDNRERAVMRWIRIRNSYHEHVIRYFSDRKGKLLVMNIEEADFGMQLARFLGAAEGSIAPTLANRDGDDTMTGTILDAIGERVRKQTSDEDIEAFFSSRGLDQQGDTLTFFESPRSGLSRSASDYCLIILPFLRPLFRWIYTVLVRGRSKARSVLSNWLVDSFIRFFRSESDMHYFTTVRQLGGGFK
ncbi:MAG: hypothetical protein IID07_00465 [Gemmatimonadetes bacterium]|nr:hypothetical protein [Gemmatimonadota bacterium]